MKKTVMKMFFALFLGTFLSVAANDISKRGALEEKGSLQAWELQSREQEIKDVVQLVREQSVESIDLHFTDMLGNLKSYTVMSSMLPAVFEKGVFFDGSSVKGYSSLSASDLKLIPDLKTFRIMPWSQGGQSSASVMCDIYDADGKPYQFSPRTILKNVVQEAKNEGYTFNVSPEIEFFLYKKDESATGGVVGIDHDAYCDAPSNGKTHTVKLQILKMLDALGMQPEKTHHEVAPDQHEITLHYADALEMADRLVLTKWIMHFVARYQGYEITFMPKPIHGENGSGMHINYSLWDDKSDSNAFFDSKGLFFLSNLAQHFIAGNLEHICSMSAIMNPVENSYKRLVPGYEAPVYVAWGSRNRSTLIRIPIVNEGEGGAVRAELRSPDAMCNPYLAFASLLKSGLYGIKNHTPVPQATRVNLFKMSLPEILEQGVTCLPGSLEEAAHTMMKSQFMNEFLGEEFVQRYVKMKAQEVDAVKMGVTVQDWERNFNS